MSIFSAIVDRIFHHSTATAAGNQTAQAGGGTASTQQAQAPGQPSQATGQAAGAQGQQRLQSVDVEAVLSQLASTKGGGGNWRTSIVDLLKLLDLDSSLTARKTLASELNVHAGADGTAEQNIALQKAVMSKIAENGGKVPESLRH
jgi:uncharacterized protein DUF3597